MSSMSGSGFIVILTLVAVMLAAWVDLRLGERRPGSVLWRGAHALMAFALLDLATALVAYVLRERLPIADQMLALFLAYLPSMTYTFLSAIWLVRTFAEVTGLARRH